MPVWTDNKKKLAVSGLECKPKKDHKSAVVAEVNFVILQLKEALVGVDGAFIFPKEVPSNDEVINKVPHDTTGHAEVATLNTKGYVDDTDGVDFAAINTDWVAFVGFDGAVVKLRIASEEAFADTRSLATRVA